MKKKFLILVFFVILLLFFSFLFKSKENKKYLVAGTGNPGNILLYTINNGFEKIKTIDTGYKFVHTVRIGDIYNNKKLYIVAGVSNSFFAQPYGCKVVSYDLDNFKENTIDNVGDLRCKDLTIGDVDNDGKNEIVLATHGLGIVRIYKWENNKWVKTDLENNFIAKIDASEKTNHRVPNDQLTCKDCVVQSAVHIVKIGDVDNDGKNELISTISSPLELQNEKEISFIKVYKKVGNTWQNYIIDRLSEREFRSVTIGDIYNTKRNALLIGIGSPRNEKGSLYAYEFSNGSWNKKIIYNDPDEKNMKGVALDDIYRDGIQRFLLATGFPKAKIQILTLKNNKLEQENIGNAASFFNIQGAEFNSMAAMTEGSSQKRLFIGGTTIYPKKNIGWEGANGGFLLEYQKKNNKWEGNILNKNNILGMDIFVAN
ncbi:MAG: hypothetical protein Q8P10_01340 [bacterium]|nr:hypothetical protein [bacterium]